MKTAPQSIIEVYYEATRRDARMRQFLDRAKSAGVRLIEADGERLAKLAGSHGHQGVAARVEAVDRKSTRLNSSHSQISYAVFCLKKKKKKKKKHQHLTYQHDTR